MIYKPRWSLQLLLSDETFSIHSKILSHKSWQASQFTQTNDHHGTHYAVVEKKTDIYDSKQRQKIYLNANAVC